MTNFDFLKAESRFEPFADAAIAAERILSIDVEASILSCRRAMECAIKWMYSVDGSLAMPYQDTLISLMNTEAFRDLLPQDLWRRMDFIRKMGNNAAHSGKKVHREQAALCLENLHVFLDFVACCYAAEYVESSFDPSLLLPASTPPIPSPAVPLPTPSPTESSATQAFTESTALAQAFAPSLDLEALMEENRVLKAELTARRVEQQPHYVQKPLELSEYRTRKLYIDAMLEDAGWVEGRDWLNEVELNGMPNLSEVGYADYVLYGTDGRPLAVLEAKRTCVDVAKGRQQAKLYADLLEKKHGRRPVIFMSNGFVTRIWNDVHEPERPVAAVYSRRDLEKLFNLRTMRTSLSHAFIDRKIVDRYYQEAAIKAVCDNFDARNRRKALVVMATGSGKTRTVIALCDVLLRHGWVKNTLFLADRNSLVTQAKRNFTNLLPDLSVTNLCEDRNNVSAHCVFSTYQTMMNCIDAVRDEEGKLFTIGHFDLVICDEAHRSIYNKYRDIFTWFDAPLVGLTATPKDEIDKNTYEVFELENGVPTYGYELAQAVQDGYLVDFLSVETELKFIEEGIVYDDLSDEDKQAYEETFLNENGQMPERIEASALNEWIFNEDTIRQVLHVLMTEGIHINYGAKLGKTILFAKNHDHAEKVYEVFGREYPHLPGYAKVIDNYMTYAQSAIDEFSEPNRLPQLAISVDMLDTGIDVPEVLNLVFFKRVMSKAKFWQMIGRGTRLCPGLLDGADKQNFYIFDFCGNFRFFRMNKGRASANGKALHGAIFHLKAQLAFKLQALEYQTTELIAFRESLIEDMVAKVRELDRNNFAVKQHLKHVDLYADARNYNPLSYESTLDIERELVPLIHPEEDEISALRFDALLYGIELAALIGHTYNRARRDLTNRVRSIADVANIPEIMAQADLIRRILHTDYLDRAGTSDFEHIRISLRDLMKYLPHNAVRYDTNFEDDILSMNWKTAELNTDYLANYREKAAHYIREHQDQSAIQKLKTNVPLAKDDIEALERILWKEIGSREAYEEELGQKPLGEFVREIVGLDMNAAKAAFAAFLDENRLDSRQIHFVNQIVEYIVHNGLMKDLSVLQGSPFTDRGSVVELFTDLNVWHGIRSVIDQINGNAAA